MDTAAIASCYSSLIDVVNWRFFAEIAILAQLLGQNALAAK